MFVKIFIRYREDGSLAKLDKENEYAPIRWRKEPSVIPETTDGQRS